MKSHEFISSSSSSETSMSISFEFWKLIIDERNLKTIFLHDILLEEHHHRNCHITFWGSLFACSICSSCFDLNFHVFVKTYTGTIVVCIILRYFVIDKSNVIFKGFLLSCRFNWWIFTWLQIFSFTLICFKFLYRYGGMVANRKYFSSVQQVFYSWCISCAFKIMSLRVCCHCLKISEFDQLLSLQFEPCQ